MNQFWGGNECERTHTLTTTTTGSKCSQKEANNRTSNQNSVLGPKRSLLYRLKDSIEVKCKTHTQQSTSSTQKRLRLVNLTENAARHFQGSLFGCFENAPYTALTIVCTINVSIDCNWLDVPNLLQKKNVLK